MANGIVFKDKQLQVADDYKDRQRGRRRKGPQNGCLKSINFI